MKQSLFTLWTADLIMFDARTARYYARLWGGKGQGHCRAGRGAYSFLSRHYYCGIWALATPRRGVSEVPRTLCGIYLRSRPVCLSKMLPLTGTITYMYTLKVTLQTRSNATRAYCMQVLYQHQHRLGPVNPDPEHQNQGSLILTLVLPCCIAVHKYLCVHQHVTVYSILVRVLHHTNLLLHLRAGSQAFLRDCTNATAIGFDNRICIYPNGCYRR